MTVLSEILSGASFFLDDEALEYIQGEENMEVSDYRLVPMFGEKYLKRLFVIVETWDHKKYGRGKREYNEKFTKEEQKIISRWYLKIYAWYLRTGIPRTGVRMSLGSYTVLCKAADFFATI